MEEKQFTWIGQISALDRFPDHVVMTAFIGVVLIAATAVARGQLVRALRGPDQGLIPEPTLTYRNFFEIIAEKLYGLTEKVIGHDAPLYFPLIGTLFVFIFSCNVIGLIPGFVPPTENLNLTLALGIFVFIYFNWVGVKAHGLGYIKHFMGPVWWLAWLILPIELLGTIFRPLSLSLRLRGNIMGDHIVLGMFSGLVPYLIPIIFYGMGLFVAFIQSFVFCLLTMVYISLASSHDH